MWSDGTTLWLAHNGDGADDAVYAYDLERGERVPDKEFELDETNRAPRGVWSDRTAMADGATMWIADSGRDKLFAHDLETGARLPDSDIMLPRENHDPRGIWSDGTTIWVLDGSDDALFAYDLASGELLTAYALHDDNDDPRGIWSDEVSVWVSNHDPKRLFAYRLPVPRQGDRAADEAPPPLERVRDEEFGGSGELTKASNNSPRGIWSDGDVMYVADESDARVYSYNMPDAIDARLASLTLSGVDIGEFSSLRYDYASENIPHGNIATLTAVPAQPGASRQIKPADHDGDPANGHHVRLLPGLEITITVTSEDGSRTRVYRLRLGEEETVGPSTSCPRGDIAEGFSLVVYEGGTVEELVACAESRDVVALYALHQGIYSSYTLGAPDFVNAAFGARFTDGVPSLTPLLVKSEGPPSTDPAGTAEVTEPWPDCLRGEIADGFNLVLFEGGSVEALAACAESLGASALYTLDSGAWVSYILGAPEFVNRAFFELFPEGLPAITPLVAKGPVPVADASQAGAASR